MFPPACVGKRVESDFRPEASASKRSFQSNPGSKKVRFNASGPTPSSTYACVSGSQSRDERMAGGSRRAKPVSSGKAKLEVAPRQNVLATINGLLACCHQSMDHHCRQPCFGTHLRAVQLDGGAAGEGWKGSCVSDIHNGEEARKDDKHQGFGQQARGQVQSSPGRAQGRGKCALQLDSLQSVPQQVEGQSPRVRAARAGDGEHEGRDAKPGSRRRKSARQRWAT